MPARSRKHPDERPGTRNADELSFKPVTPATWGDFEKLFEAQGAPKYCWCMAWRDLADRQASSSAKKQAMHALVKASTPVGLLAYRDNEPAGWCSVAPRETLRKLSPGQDGSEKEIWSIVCFFVPRKERGAGIGPALLDAAVDHAFAQGAAAIEAYPVDPDSPSYRFMGFRDMFTTRGFVETGTAGSRRHVMRLARP